jgi:hypothetical protein
MIPELLKGPSSLNRETTRGDSGEGMRKGGEGSHMISASYSTVSDNDLSVCPYRSDSLTLAKPLET